MNHTYKTKGTCSSKITFDLNGDIVTNIKFTGGCSGNLQAIQTILDGSTVEHIVKKCSGIECGHRNTSCADQLSKGVVEAFKKSC